MNRPNSYDYIKILALVAMIIDHLGYYIFTEIELLRVIGRIAFPLFLLLVGYNGSYKFDKKLGFFAILIQIGIYILYTQNYLNYFSGNILIGIILTKLVLSFITKKILIFQIIIFLVGLALTKLTYDIIDYGTFSICFGIIGLRIARYKNKWILLLLLLLDIYLIIFSINIFGFSEQIYIYLLLVVCIKFLVMLGLSFGNYSLRLTPKIDNIIIYLSKNALNIYIIHLAVIISIYLILKKI